jgi:hypothetical protein
VTPAVAANLPVTVEWPRHFWVFCHILHTLRHQLLHSCPHSQYGTAPATAAVAKNAAASSTPAEGALATVDGVFVSRYASCPATVTEKVPGSEVVSLWCAYFLDTATGRLAMEKCDR